MKYVVAAVLLALCAAVFSQQPQSYTGLDVVITPDLSDPCFFQVTETITLYFEEPRATNFVTRFIPDRITGGVATVRGISITSATDGVLAQDTYLSGYNKDLQGYIIQQVVYNPSKYSAATFVLKYSTNIMAPASKNDVVGWYFEQSTQPVASRKVTLNFPTTYLPADFHAEQMFISQAPTLYDNQYEVFTSGPTSYLHQKDVNARMYVTISYPSPRKGDNECSNAHSAPMSQGPSTSAIIGAVFGAFFGGLILFGVGAAGCVGLYWCTHTDHKFGKFKRMYDEND
jgi:hypothetical protein